MELDIFNILSFIAAAIILIGNEEIINYAERKYAREGKPFDKNKARLLTVAAAGILILKGLFL